VVGGQRSEVRGQRSLASVKYKKMGKAEIIIYKESVSPDFQIEVRVEDETVWLSQLQMAELFEATKQNISLHVNNVFKDGELEPGSTVKEYLTVQF